MKSICFVDDDQDEVRRFRQCMGDRYVIGAGTTLDDALTDLKNRRVRKPDLFLLDLYYGPQMDEQTRATVAQADEELSAKEAELRTILLKAGQSPDGGFTLAMQAHTRYSATPRVFFSRKAFLKDALTAHDKGMPVLEKPDPNDSDKGSTSQRYDSALCRHAEQIARSVDGIIYLNTWWVRNVERIKGFSTASGFFLVKVGWDLWKSGAHVTAVALWIVSLASLSLAWLAKAGK